MIRICLVEDQTIVREGLRALLRLSADLSVVAEASDGEEAVEVIERERPDVVLLDLRMPRLDGVGVLRRLRERGTLPPSLILTTFDDDAMLFDAVRAGAKGWLLKDVSLERLTSKSTPRSPRSQRAFRPPRAPDDERARSSSSRTRSGRWRRPRRSTASRWKRRAARVSCR